MYECIAEAVMRNKPGLAEKDAEKMIAETLKHSPAMAKKDIQKNLVSYQLCAAESILFISAKSMCRNVHKG